MIWVRSQSATWSEGGHLLELWCQDKTISWCYSSFYRNVFVCTEWGDRFILVSVAILQMAMLSWFEIMLWQSPSQSVWGLFPNWWLLTSLCKCLSLSPSSIPSWPQAWYQRLCHMMLNVKYSSGREVMGGDFWAEVWPIFRATHTSVWQNGTFQDREVN